MDNSHDYRTGRHCILRRFQERDNGLAELIRHVSIGLEEADKGQFVEFDIDQIMAVSKARSGQNETL